MITPLYLRDATAPRVRPTRGRHVLLVEDNALIAELLSEMLAVLGHQVSAVVANEADAVRAAHRDWPDLMIVDARLREGSGVAAIERILQTRHVPYIITSGAPVVGGRSDAVRLMKPFAEADLVQAIEDALDAEPSCA